MRSLRRLGFIAWLAISVLAGQQLVVLHDLGHAGESTVAGDSEGAPPPAKCEQHSACLQLAGALGTPEFAAVLATSSPPRALAVHERLVFPAPRRAFLSRAPPAFLA